MQRRTGIDDILKDEIREWMTRKAEDISLRTAIPDMHKRCQQRSESKQKKQLQNVEMNEE